MYAIDILRKKPHTFNFIEPDAMVSDAMSLLRALKSSFLVVMKDNEYKGVISERDFLQNILIGKCDPEVCRVETVMNNRLPYASSDTPVEEVIRMFHGFHINYIPVFGDNRFEGVITLHNVMKLLCDEKGYSFES